MLLQANRERQATLREAFNEQIVSPDPQSQINAIDWAKGEGGSLQAQAIELGLKSDSTSVQAAAVEAAMGTSDVVAGTVMEDKSDASASFSILMSQKTKAGNAMNFAAQFQGGIFHLTKGAEQAQGSLRGNTLSVSNQACSLSATLANDRPVLEGVLTCDPYISIESYPDSARVIIPLY